jgi:seryl-tRNA synthetase
MSAGASDALTRVSIPLAKAANDMVQEEIVKRVHHLSKRVQDVAFEQGGTILVFGAPANEVEELTTQAATIAQRVQRSLRNLARTIVFKSPAAEAPTFKGDGNAEGVRFMGLGQVSLVGLPLALFEYFDRVFTGFGEPFSAEPLRVPTLIPVETLAKCDYLRSFPHIVNFVSHLPEDTALVEEFQQRHKDRLSLDDQARGQMETPEAGLSPAVCYHAYSMHADQTIPPDGVTYGMVGKCFRYESSNMKDLRRLWDFSLREVVFMGTRDQVLERRERAVAMMADFLVSHGVAAEIRTASDPFFVAPDDALAKTYFQLSSDTKYEVAALLPDGSQLAVGSLNYHSDFFGRAFDVALQDGTPMQSVCVGFGLERWVYAFFAQHGTDPREWPEPVRTAPEIRRFLA